MSPVVWDDARARITAAASAIALPVSWPNEDGLSRASPPSPWLDVEASAAGANIIELGGLIWREDGTLWLHLMIPVGAGIRDGLAMRKTLSTAFRSVSGAPTGLFYRDQGFDPLGPGTDDGVYRRLTLLVRYDYQDITIA